MPNIRRISESDAAAAAPAKIAHHYTALTLVFKVSVAILDESSAYPNESVLASVDVFMKYLQTVEGGKLSLRFGAVNAHL